MNGAQIRALLWLRWRLTRNGWAKGGGLGAAIALLLGIGGVALAVFGFAGGLLGGLLALHGAPPRAVMWTWLAVDLMFLFAWMLAVLVDLQRSEIIDLPRLMHLPVSLGSAFAINYLASWIGATIAFFAPAMIGLSLGLAFDRGPSQLLLLPLSMGLLFMVTAWTYLFQGWIATWIQSPRRRRVLVIGVGLSVALMGQLPNLVLNAGLSHELPADSAPTAGTTDAARSAQRRQASKQREEARMRRFERIAGGLILAEKVVPPLWLAAGAGGLAEGTPLPALFGSLGFALLGALALRRGYRSTLRFYTRGDGSGEAATARASASDAPGKRRLVERSLPGAHEETSAVAFATLRSMLRAPEIMMGLGFSLVMLPILIVMLGATFGARLHPGAHLAPLYAAGVTSFVSLSLLQLQNNQFGYDRDAFRALLLSPVARRRILLGKNLALLFLAVPPCSVVLAASAIWLRLPPLAAVAAVLQTTTTLLVGTTVGNLLSIFFPYRIQPGSMRATKLPPGALLSMFGSMLALPLLNGPALAGPLAVLVAHHVHFRHPLLLDFGISLTAAAAALGAYAASLAPLGRLLERRGSTIVGRVTTEQE